MKCEIQERRGRMKRLLLVGVCAGFVLLSPVSMHAQDNNLPAVPKRRFKHNGRIISAYDEEKKQTVVTTQWFYVSEGIMKPRSLETGAGSINDRDNEENISLGKTSLERSKTSVMVKEGQMSFEMLFARFKYLGLLQLVNAKNVVMKVGQLEFKLMDRDLEALRDLASRMTP